jgi:ACS family hexuronate transporter-like MFS transporter
MGGLGGGFLAANVGFLINTGGYLPLFLIAGFAYLVALTVLQFLSPRLAPVKLPAEAA